MKKQLYVGASLIAIALCWSPAAAFAACDTGGTISSDTTNCQSVSGGGSLTVNSGVSVAVSSKDDSVTVGSQTSGVSISNSGTISNSGGKRAMTINGTNQTGLVIDNASGATITSDGDDAIHAGKGSALVNSGTITVNNYGTISTTGADPANGQAIDFANTGGSVAITINNYATGVLSAADSDAIRPGENATVNNWGSITSGSVAGNTGNDGIDFQDNSGGTVNNYAGAKITGARDGITGKNNITVDNAGEIKGLAGSGINLDTLSGTTYVTNRASGTITGTADGTSDGDGIDVDNVVNIKNYGKITAVGTTPGELNEALSVGGGEIDNYAGGELSSVQQAITVKGNDDPVTNAETSAYSATTIYNEGTISAASGYYSIYIVGGNNYADTITNKGTITGKILTADGDDVFNLYTGSSISGLIDGGTGNDTINLYGTGNGTLGSVANIENLNVSSGAWSLSGSQSYSGKVTIASDATATVNGDFTLASGSTYIVSLGNSGTGLLDVNGTLTIASNSTISVSGASTIGSKYVVAKASSLSGSFASITDNSSLYDYSLTYTGGSVYVTTLRDHSISLASFATTSNQNAVVNSISQTGGSSSLSKALAATPDNQMQSALNQLSGDSYASMPSTLGAISAFSQSVPSNRMMQAFGSAGASGNTPVLGYAEEKETTAQRAEKTYFSSFKIQKTKRLQSAQPSVAIWAQGFGSISRDWSNAAGAQEASSGGLMIGADRLVNIGAGDWIFGVAGSFANTYSENSSRNAQAHINSYSMVAYAGAQYGAFDIRLGVGGGLHDIRSQRDVVAGAFNDNVSAHYGAQTLQGFSELGYKIKAGGVDLEPFAGLSGLFTHTDSFSESGGAAALSGGDTNVPTAYTTLGLRAAKEFDAYTLRGSVAWRHAFGNLDPSSTLSFVSGGPSFTVNGVSHVRDNALIGAGAGYRISSNATASMDYDGVFSGKSWQHTLKASYRVTF